MKQHLLAGAAFAMFAALPASAADFPVKTPAYVPPTSVYNWTGFYIGGNAGWIGGLDTLTLSPNGPLLTRVSAADRAVDTHSYEPNGSGFTGGAQAGYNLQLGRWVTGVEADFNGSTLSETGSAKFGFIPFVTTRLAAPWDAHTETIGKNLDWFSTVRGRFGYAWGRFLIYATGGLAVADVSSAFTYFDTVRNVPFNGAESHTLVGWAVGGGVEWSIANNWSVKAEYLYMDLGEFSYIGATDIPGSPLRWGADVKAREQFARVGLNYKFDWGGLIAAR